MIAKHNKIELQELSNGLPGITPPFGASLAEAGAVCFDEQGHHQGVTLLVDGDFNEKLEIFWQYVTAQMKACWNDDGFTTELGAYGVAFKIIMALTDFTVIKRAKKGTRFDYWLGNNNDLLFQDKVRLEVSGIRKGNNSEINKRLRIKIKQVKKGDNELTAFVIIIEFGNPLSFIRKV
jgi:hypothetical protein